MGIQKFRADIKGETMRDGSIPFYTDWIGGPTLALIKRCNTPYGFRTVYIKGEPDSFYSIPAACRYKGKTIKGYIIWDIGCYVFRSVV